ncbi:hypothetical protein D3C81_1804210 [compost metagenome]
MYGHLPFGKLDLHQPENGGRQQQCFDFGSLRGQMANTQGLLLQLSAQSAVILRHQPGDNLRLLLVQGRLIKEGFIDGGVLSVALPAIPFVAFPQLLHTAAYPLNAAFEHQPEIMLDRFGEDLLPGEGGFRPGNIPVD